MADLNVNILKLPFNIHSLSMSIKSQRLAEWINKYDPTLFLYIRN